MSERYEVRANIVTRYTSYVGVLAATLALAMPIGTFATPAGASIPTYGLCPDGVDAPARIPLARLRALYGAKGDRYVTIDGVELRYRDEGTGPVLLLLHGSRSTLNQWDGVTARLKNRYRIVRFDQPPAGLSGPLTAQAMARVGSPEALVAKFLDALKIRQVTPVGVSSGGTMAYYFAATYPDRVNGVVLTNTPADSAAELQFTVTPALDAATKRTHELGVEGRAFWSNYLGFLYGDTSRIEPGLVDRYCTLNLREKEPNPFGLHALTANKDVTSAHLAAMRAPVLVAWGMRDKVLPPATADRLLARLPAAQSRSFVALETVGHYPPMESPDAVADLIDSWIRRNR
jgi:pimeloyl-ACP methyl ester carboxylesterase